MPGRNFAAGMSGGIGYVFGDLEEFRLNCNLEMVELESVEDAADIAELRDLVQKHANYTGSTVAQAILDDWDQSLSRFIKVMPTDYKRAMKELAAENAGVVVAH